MIVINYDQVDNYITLMHATHLKNFINNQEKKNYFSNYSKTHH